VGARNGLYILADALRHPERRYAAVDISRGHMRRVRLAAEHFGVRILPLTSRAEALALPSESADLVLTIEVLQFVEDDRLATSEIGRILRPGGIWWCEQELHSAGRPTRPGEDPTLAKRRLGHSVNRLSDLARAAGMNLVETRPVDGAIGRWWEGLEARIHRWGAGLHLIAFPALRALSSLTASRWTDFSPSTLLYCFEKQPQSDMVPAPGERDPGRQTV
jgi:SAM-dependent methyltransferase